MIYLSLEYFLTIILNFIDQTACSFLQQMPRMKPSQGAQHPLHTPRRGLPCAIGGSWTQTDFSCGVTCLITAGFTARERRTPVLSTNGPGQPLCEHSQMRRHCWGLQAPALPNTHAEMLLSTKGVSSFVGNAYSDAIFSLPPRESHETRTTWRSVSISKTPRWPCANCSLPPPRARPPRSRSLPALPWSNACGRRSKLRSDSVEHRPREGWEESGAGLLWLMPVFPRHTL